VLTTVDGLRLESEPSLLPDPSAAAVLAHLVVPEHVLSFLRSL
jgi:hypothetical protein